MNKITLLLRTLMLGQSPCVDIMDVQAVLPQVDIQELAWRLDRLLPGLLSWFIERVGIQRWRHFFLEVICKEPSFHRVDTFTRCIFDSLVHHTCRTIWDDVLKNVGRLCCFFFFFFFLQDEVLSDHSSQCKLSKDNEGCLMHIISPL